MNLAPLPVVHLHERRVADDLLDAAAEVGARHWQSLRRSGYLAGDVAGDLMTALAVTSTDEMVETAVGVSGYF